MATYTDARNILRAAKGTVNYADAVGDVWRTIGLQNLRSRKVQDALDMQRRQIANQERQFATTEERLQKELDAAIEERNRRYDLTKDIENRRLDIADERLGLEKDLQKQRLNLNLLSSPYGTASERKVPLQQLGFSYEPYSTYTDRFGNKQFMYGESNPGNYLSNLNNPAFGSSPVNTPLNMIPLGGFRTSRPGFRTSRPGRFNYPYGSARVNTNRTLSSSGTLGRRY